MIAASLFILSEKFLIPSTLMLSIIALTMDPMLFSAAAVIVISAVAAAAVTVISAVTNAKKELLALQNSLIAKADVIAGHVDGMASAAAATRTANEDTITGLRRELAESNKRAELLAVAAAQALALLPQNIKS